MLTIFPFVTSNYAVMKQEKKVFIDLRVDYRTGFIGPVLNNFGFGFVCRVNFLEQTQNVPQIFLQNILRRHNVTFNNVIYNNHVTYLEIKYHYLGRLYYTVLIINLYDKMF